MTPANSNRQPRPMAAPFALPTAQDLRILGSEIRYHLRREPLGLTVQALQERMSAGRPPVSDITLVMVLSQMADQGQIERVQVGELDHFMLAVPAGSYSRRSGGEAGGIVQRHSSPCDVLAAPSPHTIVGRELSIPTPPSDARPAVRTIFTSDRTPRLLDEVGMIGTGVVLAVVALWAAGLLNLGGGL